MKRLLSEMPRPVLISAAVIIVILIGFAALLPVLGGAKNAAVELNTKTKADIDQASKSMTQAKADETYVRDHQKQFEELIGGDRLVPHTRRAAIVELQDTARTRGLTTLNYNFTVAAANSPKAAQSRPQSAAYNVSVENIELKVGAPSDGAIYRFISDITTSFPGSIVIDNFDLRRPVEITPQALEAVSLGQESQLVAGSIKLSWRTAQAQEKNIAANAK